MACPCLPEANAGRGGCKDMGAEGVCKIEIIATNRPHRPWIPAYAGMTEWARLDSGLRRNDGMGPIVSIWERFCI